MPSLEDALSGLQYVGESLDKPGRAVRGGLSGNYRELLNLIPFSDAMGLTDASEAVSGRDLLEKAGLAGENTDQGWIPDAGDLGGFAAEMALDPLNLVGGIGLAKRLMGISKAKTANRGTQALIDAGAMSDEMSKATRIRNAGVAHEASQPALVHIEQPHLPYEDFGTSSRGYVMSKQPFDTERLYDLDDIRSMIDRSPDTPKTYRIQERSYMTPDSPRELQARRLAHKRLLAASDLGMADEFAPRFNQPRTHGSLPTSDELRAWAQGSNVDISEFIPPNISYNTPWKEMIKKVAANNANSISLTTEAGSIPGRRVYDEYLSSHPLGPDKVLEHLGYDSVVKQHPDISEDVLVRLLQGASEHTGLAQPLQAVPQTPSLLAAMLAAHNSLAHTSF